MNDARGEDRRRTLGATVLRITTSGIFVIAGLGHLVKPERFVDRLMAAPMADLVTAMVSAHLLVIATGLGLLAGGLALAAGWKTRYAAALLFAMLVPITVSVHVGGADHIGPLFKNIALGGVLIYFVLVGADPGWSLDRRYGGQA